jgi:hypothetical protein
MLMTRKVNDVQLGGDYGTALCAACANGKAEVVKALLGAGARGNGDGKEMNTQEWCRCSAGIRDTLWGPTSRCCTDGKQGNGGAPDWR